jgi:DNA repair protein RadC
VTSSRLTFEEVTMKQKKRDVEEVPENRIVSLRRERLSDLERQSVVQLALEILRTRHRRGRALSSPEETRRYLQFVFEGYRNEVFGAIFLDNRHRVLGFEELFYGTIDGASVHPRVVVQRTLDLNAAAVIFAHNHPSGVAEPSRSDESLTRRLKEALTLVDVRVLDHIVVGSEGTVSFAERGLL